MWMAKRAQETRGEKDALTNPCVRHRRRAVSEVPQEQLSKAKQAKKPSNAKAAAKHSEVEQFSKHKVRKAQSNL